MHHWWAIDHAAYNTCADARRVQRFHRLPAPKDVAQGADTPQERMCIASRPYAVYNEDTRAHLSPGVEGRTTDHWPVIGAAAQRMPVGLAAAGKGEAKV